MKKFANFKQAVQLVQRLGEEFAVVKNPEYIYSPFEIYPLAPKLLTPLKRISAVVMDMDGTTTTTEALCIHSLEIMTRKITRRMSRRQWRGLDPLKDYPNIIGNSTTKHIEYLVQNYRNEVRIEALIDSYILASLWFITYGKDPDRLAEVINNLCALGLKELLNDPKLKNLPGVKNDQMTLGSSLENYYLEKYRPLVKVENFSHLVRMAIDIYYQRYHEILGKIQAGAGEKLSNKLLGKSRQHLIEPMPGIGIFLALLKGLLGDEFAAFDRILIENMNKTDLTFSKNLDLPKLKQRLQNLGRFFQQRPVKVSVVTSSIYYEANIVLSEVFRILLSEIDNWPLSGARKSLVKKHFTNYQKYYDCLITASDSSEIRLKPHRDLYCLALHRLGIPKSEFKYVIGFEDSESGTIAIRAAGIGRCVAVPFSETAHHNFKAATHIIQGGIPETILKYNLFVNQEQ